MKNVSRFVLKRQGCINSSADSRLTISFNSIKSIMESGSLTYKNVCDYLDGLMSVKEANKEFSNPIEILRYYNENKPDDRYAIDKYCECLYYVSNENIKDLNKNIERCTSLSENAINSIKETTDNILLADKMIHNHDIMSKRFDFKDISFLMSHNNIKAMVECLSVLVDTYNIPYYQKMNIALEESVYLSVLNGCNINMDNLVYEVTKFYLLGNKDERDNIKRVLSENKLVADMNTDYIFESEDIEDISSLTKLIDNIIATGDITDLNHRVFHTIELTTDLDILANIEKLLSLFEDLAKNSENKDIVIKSLEAMNSALLERGLTRENLSKLYAIIQDKKKNIGNKDIANNIDNILRSLDDNIAYRYSGNNISAIQFITQEGIHIPLPKFKKFKFNGILAAVHNLDKFLAKKEKIMLGKIKNKTDKFKKGLTNVLFGESFTRENLAAYIGSDNKIDVCVRQYLTDEFTSVRELNDFLDACVNEFNSSIQPDSSIRAYYTIIEGLAEIHIKDRTILEMEDKELVEVNESYSTEDNLYYELFKEANELVDHYSTKHIFTIKEYIESMNESFTREHFDLAVEAMKYLSVSKEDFDLFCSRYSDIAFENSLLNEESKSEDEDIFNIRESWSSYEDVPYDIALEASELLSAIFEDVNQEIFTEDSTIDEKLKSKGYYSDEDKAKDNKGKSNDDEDDESDDDYDDEDEEDDESDEKKDKSDKKPSDIVKLDKLPEDDYKVKTKMNLSSIKLSLKGLYSKFKNMNQKQKEASRNLDNAIKTFVEGIKKADSNERREAIIKGSIIPSFSRCIKFSVVLAGLGVATGGLGVPVITAIGALALDKKLTKKERMLLLDEIETELEVIEKELAMADSNGQINKYRALLRYKKDLQRQYQRIRYNVRVGQDAGYFKASTGVSND